jgi:Zn-dependent peptidase ImmA (M78 family)
MNWIPDNTGRFAKRPYYTPEELDAECEKIVTDFLRNKYGKIEFPISTEDLKLLLEQDVADLDLYADFATEGNDIEGDTKFFHGAKPKVRILKELTENDRMENRLRTTLTHEYGHVFFHTALFELERKNQSLFSTKKKETVNQCKREAIFSNSRKDWMEWQAGYACGAILIPSSYLKDKLVEAAQFIGIKEAVAHHSTKGNTLIAEIANFFQVSIDAATVRLLQKGVFSEPTGGLGLGA